MKRFLKKSSWLLVFVLLATSFLTVGCSEINLQEMGGEIPKITCSLVSENEEEGKKIHIYELTNGSKYNLKHNVVYFSYPIKTEQGHKSNPFKIEALDNKLDIASGEKVELKVEVPLEIFMRIEDVVVSEPSLEIKGYINAVEQENLFHKTL